MRITILTLLIQVLHVNSLSPATLDATVKIELTMEEGQVHTDSQSEDEWYVPYQFYMLTKVKMWKNTQNTSGFEVTFSPYPPEDFTDWPDEVHHFGRSNDDMEEISLDSDLTLFQMCVDNTVLSDDSDFEGLFFKEFDGDYQSLNPICSER